MPNPCQHISPFEIEPLHEVRNQSAVAEIVQEMSENGWRGRPLLVIRSTGRFVAWTGSHRIAAARDAGLATVPCYVLDESRLAAYDVDARWGHVDDTDRLRIIQKVGDPEALHLMWQEGRSN